MSRTKRWVPYNGEFKKLKASKQKRNKKQRKIKANLQKHIQFASKHRAAIDMTQMSVAVYMQED